MIHLSKRLSLALDMLSGSSSVADIGCDHGRLACALVQQQAAARVIATDIAEAPLQRARELVSRTGLEASVELRRGDGLGALLPGEVEAISLLGMGGTLMARLLEEADEPFQGAKRIVFQPMRAVEDIRRYLYVSGCHILEDRLVLDGGRIYQVFMAGPPSADTDKLPAGWPAGYYRFGYTAFAQRDPLLGLAVKKRLAQLEKRLKTEQAEALMNELAQLRQIADSWEEPI